MINKRIAIFKHGPGRQSGSALMIIMVLLIVGLAAVLLNSLTSSAVKNARQQKTAAALAQAKEALIGYAITYGDTHSNQVHGYLPCPDVNGKDLSNNPAEGVAEVGCGSQDVSVIGRLPWATLDLSTLRDGDGECLWYAVSGTYKNSPKTGLMNWDTNGQLQVYSSDGSQLASQVVAVIFAPGAPLAVQNQNRSPDGSAPICGGKYTAASYLDTGTVNTINFNNTDIASGNFIQGTSGGSINDQMVFITRQDIWNAIQKRTDFQSTDPSINPLIKMTNQVALCLVTYAQHNAAVWINPTFYPNYSLPWPTPLSLGTNALTDYYPNANYQDSTTQYEGRVPYSVTNSKLITHNSLSNLMTTASCGAGWASVDIWWNNWKDHLFYAIGKTYRPTTNITQSCGTCLQVNGSGQYAAVVMFAGPGLIPPLSTLNQTRANKSVITYYLESSNASNFPDTTGNKNYKAGSASPTFNDVLYCIDSHLDVDPC